jgi:hypothetical protein
MEGTKEHALYTKYPALLTRMGGDMRQTCMAFGLAVGDGWYSILDTMLLRLSTYDGVVLEQCKEKFAQLCVYVDFTNEDLHENDRMAVYAILDEASEASGTVCERCGGAGRMRGKGWWRTACDDCEAERP